MRFQVRVTSAAERDMDEAFDWYLEQSSSAALSWQEQLAEALRSLETFPERCPLAPDHAFLRRAVRQLVFGRRRGPYRLLFEVGERKVFVLRLRHGARMLLDSPDDD